MMKPLGDGRRVHGNGIVSVSIEVCDKLNITRGEDMIRFFEKNGEIIIRKVGYKTFENGG